MSIEALVRTGVAYLTLPAGIAGLGVACYQIKKLRKEIDEANRRMAKGEARIVINVSLAEIEKYGRGGRFWDEKCRNRGLLEPGGIHSLPHWLQLLPWTVFHWLRPVRLNEQVTIPSLMVIRARVAKWSFLIAGLLLWVSLFCLLRARLSVPEAALGVG
jgi:hypothetical protein